MIQGVLDLLQQLDGRPRRLQLVTGARAETSRTFRARFELDTGRRFTPQNFRTARLQLLDQADAMVVIRTGLSESGAFELAYNIFGGNRVPVFFAVWKRAPIETTLLRDLDELVPIRYVGFADPRELRAPLLDFFDDAAAAASKASGASTSEDRLTEMGEAEGWLPDTRWPLAQYRDGFALNGPRLESVVDEGGESG